MTGISKPLPRLVLASTSDQVQEDRFFPYKRKSARCMQGLTLLILVVIVFSAGCTGTGPVACTADAKICPDGSAVGRVPPDCEFALCPPAQSCSSYTVDRCPDSCVVCPPCPVCSSISCQTEEFCHDLGFEKDWYHRSS